jgi:hypothetical protein
MSTPRQHHIIPACYLSGFTDTGTAGGRIFVFDYLRNRHFETSPKTIARERDFYRIEEPGVDPNAIEMLLSEFESHAAPILSNVRDAGRFENNAAVKTVLSFAALVLVRNRHGQQRIGEGLSLSLRKHLAQGDIPRDLWERIRKSQIRMGVAADAVPEYDAAVDGARSGSWDPPPVRILQLGLIPEMQDAMLEAMLAHDWQAIATDSSKNGGFICSDSPLVWGSLDDIHNGQLNTPLTDPDVEITFPVGKNLALVSYPGAFKGNSLAPDELVAHVNMRTLQLSNGLVLHAAPDFLLRPASGVVSSGSAYYEYVARKRREGIENP